MPQEKNLNEKLEESGFPDKETVIQTETELISGLLSAAGFRNDESGKKRVQIKRNNKVLFRFDVRPLSESELQKIRKRATSYMPNPQNARLPKIEKDFRIGEFRSWKVYTATTDEYKEKLWDNPEVVQGLRAKGFHISESADVIDACLMAGEKDQISDLIDDISGYNGDLLDYAKN